MYKPGSAIVGVAESVLGVAEDEHPLRLMARAAVDALADAGLTLRDVDGVMTAGLPTWSPALELCDYLGLSPDHVNGSDVGGSSFEFHLAAADAAIASNQCSTVLIAYANTPRQDRRRREFGLVPPDYTFHNEYERSSGLLFPDIGPYALAADRHMFEFGTTSEQLAEIAVAARKWAQLNPRAFRHEDLSIEDVLASPLISSPLHTRDCCLVTDGGGAVVVTSTQKAQDAPKYPIKIMGYGQAIAHGTISMCHDLVRGAAQRSSKTAYEMAGVGPGDVDVAQIYDSFTITVLMSLEDLGFCKKGEGGAFVEDGRLRPEGDFPMNTSGGGLSYCHPGRFGIFLIIEAVRQLRGEGGDRQVPSAEICLVHGTGGSLSSVATVVLGR